MPSTAKEKTPLSNKQQYTPTNAVSLILYTFHFEEGLFQLIPKLFFRHFIIFDYINNNNNYYYYYYYLLFIQ